MIVFICTFDPFGYHLYRYTFEKRCKEVDIALGDDTKTIFLSTEGDNADEVPKELVHFLKYVEDSTDECVEQADDKMLDKLHEKVKKLKSSRELEESYMQFEELLKQERDEGRHEGKAEGKLEGKIEQIQKKLGKGLDVATIAEHLEESVDLVEKIVTVIRENPSAGEEEILEKLK